MNKIFLDSDCGRLGQQDLEIGYDGDLSSGLIIRSIKIMSDELIGIILSHEIDRLHLDLAEELYERRKINGMKKWDAMIKYQKEE